MQTTMRMSTSDKISLTIGFTFIVAFVSVLAYTQPWKEETTMKQSDIINERRVTKPEDVPETPHFQVLVHNSASESDGYGGSYDVLKIDILKIDIYIFTLQSDAEAYITRHMLASSGSYYNKPKPIWCQRSSGRAKVETITTIKVGL